MRRLVRASSGDPGEAFYTLAPGESFRLESVVASLSSLPYGAALVPTLRITAADGSILAEISASMTTS